MSQKFWLSGDQTTRVNRALQHAGHSDQTFESLMGLLKRLDPQTIAKVSAFLGPDENNSSQGGRPEGKTKRELADGARLTG